MQPSFAACGMAESGQDRTLDTGPPAAQGLDTLRHRISLPKAQGAKCPVTINMILPLRSLLSGIIKPGLIVDAPQVWVKKLRGAKYGPYQSETREHVSGIEHAGERACRCR